ncbi:MAG: hypothetical protein HOH17_06290 [Halieaceae bacterium]|nr:hypothetical protein [Halieaceae bacterium]
MKTTFESLALLLLLTITAAVNAAPMNTGSLSHDPSAFIYEMPIEELDPIAMESTRGGLAPLALALGIAGVDLALMSFYWGIYVPNYAPSSPHYYTEAP